MLNMASQYFLDVMLGLKTISKQKNYTFLLVGDYPQQKEFKIVDDDFSYVCIEIQNKTF